MISFINGRRLNSMKNMIVRYARTLMIVVYNKKTLPSTLSGTSECSSNGLKQELCKSKATAILAMLTSI